jgi:ClpP class serine protease
MDFFTPIFIFMMLQPVIRQKMLEASRLRLIAKLEKQRNSRVITLIHRQETMGFLGFPIFRYIDIDDSEAVLRAVKMTDENVPIDMILHTPGGLVLAAEQIAHAIQRRKAKVTVIVPHYAMSGGTLPALAADEIVMDDNAVLGPVDPQLGQQAAASIVKVLQRKPIERVRDETIMLADLAEKSLRQVTTTVTRLLSKRMNSDQSQKTAELLASGTWTHDYPILVEAARELGLPVNTGVPEDVYHLMALYPQSQQRRPSVEYTGVPRRLPEAPDAARDADDTGNKR